MNTKPCQTPAGMIWDALNIVRVFVTAYALRLKTDKLKFIEGSLI